MSISNEDVKHIAKLSRLTISEEETVEYAKDLSEILDYVEKLSQADTSNVEPTANITDSLPGLRKDEIIESFEREQLLKNAPQIENNHFLVPKVIE